MAEPTPASGQGADGAVTDDETDDEGLRILMVAPEPYFRPHGTPFSVRARLDALSALGHEVELHTYPFGEDRAPEDVDIRRSRRPPGIRDVAIGPSLGKIFLDVPLFEQARRRLEEETFDLIHTHEEAGVLGSWLARHGGIPHLYDMHSSLPEQFENFGRFDWPPVVGSFRALERYILAGSDAVITICSDLKTHVRAVGYGGPVAVIENTQGAAVERPAPSEIGSLRKELDLGTSRVAVYTGTFEAYQGLDLLIEAASVLRRADGQDVHFVLVGGDEERIASLRRAAESAGVADLFDLLPPVPPERVSAFHRLADVLVTPRTRGRNTPLKVYDYLRASRPIVATSISAHTGVLDHDTAELVNTSPQGIASGIKRVISDSDRARSIARSAQKLALDQYTEEEYRERLAELLEEFHPASRQQAGR